MDIFVKCDVLQPCFHCTHGNGHQSQAMNNLPWSQISRRCWKQLSAMQRSLSNGWQYILTTQTSCHLHSWLAMVMKSQIMLLNLINLSACSLLAEFLSESRHVDVMTEDWFSYAFCFVAYTFQAMTFRFYLDFYKGIASTCMLSMLDIFQSWTVNHLWVIARNEVADRVNFSQAAKGADTITGTLSCIIFANANAITHARADGSANASNDQLYQFCGGPGCEICNGLRRWKSR